MQIIQEIWLPAAIRLNIPYEQFWGMNPRIIYMYQDAMRDNIEQQQKIMDYQAWLNGSYIVSAIQVALSPRKCKYPNEPYSTKKKLSGEEQFLDWIEVFNAGFKEE